MYGETRGAYSVSVVKPEGKRPFGVPSLTWEGNIKIDLKGIWWEVVTGLISLRMGTSDGLL
jgi:hypothetical protein